jgi:23S rRNA pseudouridine1911/1915/1917 synthase
MSKFEVSPEHQGERIDKFLQDALQEFSRTDIQKILLAEKVLQNDQPCPKNLRVKAGMVIEVLSLPEKMSSHLEPENIPLNIVYEDKDMIILNKPRNLVVHPGSGVQTGTLAAGLLYHFKKLSKVNGPLRPGIVHRLDKDTPGLMVVARTDKAHQALAQQLESREIERIYYALIWGQPKDLEGTVDAPIDRDPDNRIRMAVVKNGGKAAVTHYKVLESFRFATLVECKLETGRTHQIRVHMRHIGHPIVGDPIYEGGECALHRIGPLERPHASKVLKIAPAQMLQAVRLSLLHPRTQKPVKFEIPLEGPFSEILAYLRKNAPALTP